MLLLGFLPLAALGLSIALFQRRTGDAGEAIVLGALSWSYATGLGTEAHEPRPLAPKAIKAKRSRRSSPLSKRACTRPFRAIIWSAMALRSFPKY